MSTIEKALAKQKKATEQSKSVQPEPDNTQLKNEPTSNTAINNSANQVKEKSATNNNNTTQFTIQLDKADLLQRGFLTDPGERRQAQEEFRNLKRKLINNAFGSASKVLNHSNLIMVTSSNPNEGKTFVSINLALSIAMEQDKTVLLVDADVLRPSIARELGFDNQIGLVDYLLSEVNSVQEILYNTSIPNLRVIPSGKPHHLTNELLASERMASLAAELANRYPDRIVIFDCPPILGVTETPVLANLMGQAVIVVEESKTRLDDVKKATKQLNEDLAIGLVLNKTVNTTKDSYGYYGYGYGYGDKK